MPTIFDKAMRCTAAGHRGVAAPNAVYDNMPTWAVIQLMRFDGGSDGLALFGKGDVSTGKLAFYSIEDRIALRVSRASAPDFFLPDDEAAISDNSWHWLMIGYDAAINTRTVYIRPKGGTAVSKGTALGGGSGALSDDAAFPWAFGSNGSSTNGAFNTDRAFMGILDYVPTIGQFTTITDDALAATWDSHWKPEDGDTTSLPNRTVADPVLPPLVLTGATIVDGPDDPPPPVYDGIEVVSNPNTGPITAFPHVLDPIVLRPIDQYGDPWTGTVPADGAIPANHCSATSIGLPWLLGGTTLVALSGGVWTFSDLIALAEAEPGILAAPTITLGAASGSGSTHVRGLSVASSGTAWPSGTTVRLQTRRAPAAFADVGGPITSTGSLSFVKESTTYSVELRSFASSSGYDDSEFSSVVTITVPALQPITPGESAMPLRAKVSLYPATSQALSATSTGAIPTLNARSRSDHILRVTDITEEPELGGAPAEPTSIRYTISDDSGVLIGPLDFPEAVAAGDYRLVLPRALFEPSRGSLTLDLALVAEDDSETALTFILAQGVRQ